MPRPNHKPLLDAAGAGAAAALAANALKRPGEVSVIAWVGADSASKVSSSGFGAARWNGGGACTGTGATGGRFRSRRDTITVPTRL
jgi:hypothetical protein